jgi:hypothetical protein
LLRSYDKFSEAERRMIMKWQLRLTVFYGAAFLVLIAFVITNHEIGHWAASATQAEIKSSIAGPTINPAQIVRNANKSPTLEAKKPF